MFWIRLRTIIQVLRADTGVINADIVGFVRVCITQLEGILEREKGCKVSANEVKYPLRRDVAQLGSNARYVSNDVNEPRELLET